MRVDGNTLSFPLLEPHKLVIKAAGALPLALLATPLEENVPAAGGANVLYFRPGTHEPGVIQPTSGQTVYLASGALVKGRIEVADATGVHIRGRGTLDARGFSIRGLRSYSIYVHGSSDVHVEGIGLRGGTTWQSLFLLTNDTSVTHVSLFGVSVNIDGIDGFHRVEPGEGWLAMSFASRYGRACSLEVSADLGSTDTFVELLSLPGAGSSTRLLFHDPAMILSPRRFYRVALD